MCDIVTLEEFNNSAFNCQIGSCCSLDGEALESFKQSLLELSQDMITNYLGYDLCMKEYTDKFRGDDSTSYFTKRMPVNIMQEVTLAYRKPGTNPLVGTITDFELIDSEIGQFYYGSGLNTSNSCFDSNFFYTLTYTAGYEPENIPNIIKQCLMMLAVNLSLRLDNLNLSTVDFSVDSIKVDKASSTTFGQGKMIKQVVAKNIKEFNQLPLFIEQMLDPYKLKIL